MIESCGYGYTEFRTYGAYMENGSARGSDTMVYMIMLADGADVEEISKQAAEQLNLESVLCQKEEREYEFFVGEEKLQ